MTRGKSCVPTAKSAAKSAELVSSAFKPRTTGTSLCAPPIGKISGDGAGRAEYKIGEV
jgi:hypothetical protein